jgi:hypothetical protein
MRRPSEHRPRSVKASARLVGCVVRPRHPRAVRLQHGRAIPGEVVVIGEVGNHRVVRLEVGQLRQAVGRIVGERGEAPVAQPSQRRRWCGCRWQASPASCIPVVNRQREPNRR